MATIKWVTLLTVLLCFHGFAQDNRWHLTSRYEIQQHLLSGGTDGSLVPQLFPEDATSQRKSKGLAAAYSLLVPGMGELYADGFESGKYFLIAEGVLWLTYATFEIYGNQLRDDSRAFARTHAGANPQGKGDQFFVDIGNFGGVDEYNQKKLRDFDFDKVYNDPSYEWNWDSDLSRTTYRSQRIASENMYNDRKFVVAAILINHVGSAINAVRAAISYNNSLDDAVGDLDIRADVMGTWAHPRGIMLTVTKTF